MSEFEIVQVNGNNKNKEIWKSEFVAKTQLFKSIKIHLALRKYGNNHIC